MEKVKLIRGSKERAEEILKTLEKWGGTNDGYINCENKDYYYYVDPFGYISCLYYDRGNNCIAEGRAEIYELPPLKPECNLKPFDKVLVRDTDNQEWKCNIFSHLSNDHFICIVYCWNQCIPYEGNEYLLGTTDNPKPLYNTP